jgi:RimJ/RimL family protein N-acetyltransferase
MRLGPVHYDFLASLDWSSEHIAFGRFRGVTPRPEALVDSFWAGVTAVFVVQDATSESLVGAVVLYGLDARNGFAYVSVNSRLDDQTSIVAMEGLALLLSYAFALWPLRKVYAEVAESNMHRFGSGAGSFFSIEGCLKGHYYYNGLHYDKLLLAVGRDQWDSIATRLRLSPPAQ